MSKTIAWAEGTFVNVTEPFTVMLTNEAQQFATDSNRKVTSAQSYYTDIIVIRGSQERTDYTIGNITSGSGITVSKSSKRVTFSVSADTTIGADTGVIEIPITLDGQTVKKQFSWSCGKQGPQGVQGNDGNSFAWNMLSETNCGKKHWGTESSGGKYSVEDFITEDNIDAVKLICTEAISTSNWSYVSFKDIKMLKQLKPSTKYTLSYDIKANRSGAISHSICKGDVSNFCTNTVVVNNIIGNETWQHISVVLTTNDLKTTPTNEILYLGRNALSKVGYSIIKNLKLVEGDIDTPWSPSQSDIEGKGVVETVQYYLATSQASGVTSSTSGWSTDITTQKLTADKKYLWNCYQTKYSDGTSEPISTPKVIGVYGDKGQKGDPGEDGQDGAGFYWNLLSGTKDLDKSKITFYSKATIEPTKYLDFTVVKATALASSYSDILKWHNVLTPTPNTTYTLSFYAKASVETYCRSHFYPSCTVKNISNYETTTASDGGVRTKLSTEWNRYSVTWTTSSSVSGAKSIVPIRLEHGNTADGATVYLCGIKLEQSDKPSPWCTTYEETLAKNLSITPSSQYFKSTDGGKTFAPDTITIKPTIQGEISFGKWQYSIDGGVSFADVVSGQKGLTVSNNVLAVSKDSSLYSDAVTMVTFRAVANDSSFYDTCSIAKIYDVSDIGDGRNLLWNSNFAKTDEAITGTTNSWGLHTRGTNLVASIDTSTKHNGFNTLKTVSAANGDKNSSNDLEWFAWGISERTSDNLHSKNQNYTLSFYAKASVTTDFIVRWGYDAYGADTTRTLTTNWQKYEIKLHQATSAYSITIIFKLLTAGTVWFSEFKLEKGSSATGYSTAPEDLQTAILSTKSEISDVSLKVDKNKQAIEQRVEKTTYQQDLNLVKGDISKANEGLNKWRYEIYPKSLFADKPEDQSKYDIGVFIRNKNLTPSRTLVFDDNKWTLLDYENNYIGYGLTFVKMSAKKTFSTKWAHSSSCSIYVNGKLIISDKGTVRLDSNNTGRDFSCTFIEGWNCIEFVMQETIGNEWFFFKDAISAISECQLMNCYYGTPVARQSHITNQLVQNTTDIDGVSGSVQKVMSTVGGSGKVDEFVNNYSTWKKKVDGIETRVGKTYVTKNDFDGLEIGGVNLFVKSTASRGWWISDTGVLNANGGWGYSDYINVSGMKNYIASGFTNLGISPATCFYDSNKTFISGVQSTNQNSQDSKRKTLPIPSNAKYMRFSFMLVDIDTLKIEQGTKATAYSPAPEDDEINGQNLVSNLPSNWEQGTVTEGSTTGTTYANTKSSSAGSVRPKELIPVSGNITISTAYSNQSKKPIRHWIAAYDVNKNYLGNNYVSNAWNSFPRTLNMKDAKYIAIMVGYTDSSAITPSDISQICLKIERGTSATPFTLAPEDVNGKIVNVETIANQTAKKFEWIVKSGTSASNFEITDKFMNLVSTNINLDGIVSFMNTAKGDGRKNLYNLDYSSFENVASQEDAICYAKDNGVTSVGIDSSVSYDGDKSLKISYTTANLNSSTTPLYLGSSTNNYGCVKIQAGKQYILSCYVKSDSTTGMFMIDIQGHDTPDTKTDGLYLSNIDPRRLPGSSTYVDLNTNWQRAVCAIKVADNATGLYWSVVPLIWGRPSSSSAPKTFNVWVDCIMLEEVDSISNEPGTYILDKETIIDGGSIKTDTITGNQILAGSITADKIATDAIKSRNYISSGGTQGSFLNLGDGSFTSPNLSWDSNGNLIAKNANLSGEITATNGSIAGWTIISNKMYTTGSGKYTGIGKYGSAYAFWAGATSNDNGNSAVFKVGHTGKLTATDADITGTITATNGKIGRYDITSTYLMTNSGSNASGIGGNQAFWAGAEDSNSAPFRVGYDGVLWAENAAIRGSIETGNLGDEGDTVSIINGHIGIQGTSNNVEIYSTGFKFGIDGDYYLMSVSEGVKCYRNLYATDFVADGWLYCSEVHSSGAVVIGADSESFYWAHGYQIARGTSWGGVCVGDDSQQLRLYGSSIWASHSISTSDENLKENFTTLDQYENFYMNLNPIGFNYIGDYDGKKTHFGFGAHKTEDVLESEGYDADKFAVVTHRPLVQEDIEKRFGKDVEVDIETEYGVSYTEFIALNTHMIQKTRRELTKVKQEKADLEVRLQAIEAKLGL